MLSKNQIKEIQSLQLKKVRDQKALFIAEGIKTVQEIILNRPEIVQQVFATEDFLSKNSAMFKQARISFVLVTREELSRISMQAAPSGALAVCRFFENKMAEPDFNRSVSFYLDDIRDPGNFGTIIRLADWFGHGTLFCSPSSCEVYNPKVIQSTMGAFLRVSVVYIELKHLVAAHPISHVFGAVLNGENLFKEEITSGLMVIGNEANGISDQNLKLLTKRITIPAAGQEGSESLNAAMAASIIAAEVFRQKLQ